MSRMQEARISRKLTQGHVAKLLKEVEPRLDTPLVSKYEAGICLPTKRQIEKLESIYGLDRTEMYAVEDLDLLEIGPKLTAPEKGADRRKTEGQTGAGVLQKVLPHFQRTRSKVAGRSAFGLWFCLMAELV